MCFKNNDFFCIIYEALSLDFKDKTFIHNKKCFMYLHLLVSLSVN